jgi:hypothetical protein
MLITPQHDAAEALGGFFDEWGDERCVDAASNGHRFAFSAQLSAPSPTALR